ncbi:MAG TPA: PSD1 and planctomycete cytochrome C domain-containing protein [Candidatus Dormibacteraeota bacterium]|nr:PSD1 and planctomycete cytochrome C domain-containing protein [Candidatus Dormibacteraeota bacterium]
MPFQQISAGAPWCIRLLLTSASLVIGFYAQAGERQPAASSTSNRVDYARDIQPLFENHCYECHGPKRQEAEFRLDSREVALKGGELGVAIVPRKAAESLLIQAVSGLKPNLVMPKKGARLNANEIRLLRAWIDQGAVWPENPAIAADEGRKHWAFKAPVRPPVPQLRDKKWVRTPIDAFVLAKLEREKLRPSAPADRRTLLRRLSLDLTGLPPSIKEIETFANDKNPDAYEHAVKRLLASPHYGERWGRQWLDVARYADTNGYEKDKPRSIWPYRDWVINALNSDMPFTEFTIEQLAGDLLPNATVSQKVATGFLRNSMLNQEGGIEPEQFRVEALIDRVDTLGKAFLGLTINCCQCHPHKYDPFSQKEYYQLYAFLNNDDESFIEVPTHKHDKERAEVLSTIRALTTKALKDTTNVTERMAEWENTVNEPTTNWTILEPKDWQNFATKFEKQEDNSLLGGGDLQPGGVMRVWTETRFTNITGLRLEALTNANLIYGGPGLLGKGTFMIAEFEAEAWASENPTVTNKIKFRRALADMEAPEFGITNTIDGITTNGGWTPAITPDWRNKNHFAVFEAEEPFGFPGGTKLLITLEEKVKSDKALDAHMLGCFRLSATTDAAPLRVEAPYELRSVLRTADNQRTGEQKLALFNWFRLTEAAFTNLNKEIEQEWTKWPDPPTTLVLHEREHPRVTHVFKRGDRLRPTDEVTAGVPEVLNPLPPAAPRNRLGLARWIVDRRSPTTARVIVNRIWQAYFGQGLVTTPEDFGTRVETPSHPELLDWLACEFMDSGWSLKHMHQLIVESATYRQNSRVTPELYAKDPYNRLLARGPRFRVEAEEVQDVALSVSGLLNLKIGGPSIYPPIPANVGDTAYGGFTWPETKGEERYRRGMYTFWKRSLPFPSLSTFDEPTSESSCPRRVRSNTPLQALTTLNEKTFVEAEEALALRILKQGGSDNHSRIDYGFELCTGRKPTGTEEAKLLKFWAEQYNYFENRTAAAVKVAVPDINQMPADVNLHKAAAWAMVSRALLNLDETITKE